MIHIAHLTLAFHIILMMVASAGPSVALILEFFGTRSQDATTRAWGRVLAWHSLLVLTLAILVGVIAGMLLDAHTPRAYGPTLIALKRRVLWGTGEIVFSYLLLLMYAACWRWSEHRSVAVRTVHRSLAVLSTLNLLYHFPPLMVILADIATSDPPYPPTLDAAAFRRRAWQPTVVLSSLHFSVGAFTIAASWIAAVAASSRNRPLQEDTTSSRTITLGACVALIATGMQFPLGLWLLAHLPASAQRPYLGGNSLATASMATAVLLALWLLHQLAAIAFGNRSRWSAHLALGTNVAVIVLMVIAKHSHGI